MRIKRQPGPQTLWSSASFFPAHISFTIRCHRSHSVLRLASKTSFLDTILIFKVGILRSRKATVVLLTSCRGKKRQVNEMTPSGTLGSKGNTFRGGGLHTLRGPDGHWLTSPCEGRVLGAGLGLGLPGGRSSRTQEGPEVPGAWCWGWGE